MQNCGVALPRCPRSCSQRYLGRCIPPLAPGLSSARRPTPACCRCLTSPQLYMLSPRGRQLQRSLPGERPLPTAYGTSAKRGARSAGICSRTSRAATRLIRQRQSRIDFYARRNQRIQRLAVMARNFDGRTQAPTIEKATQHGHSTDLSRLCRQPVHYSGVREQC